MTTWAVTRQTVLEVRIDGVLDTAAVSATCSFGFDQRYAEATVTRTGGATLTISYWSAVEIRMGTTPGLGATVRFAGYVVPIDNDLYPIANVLHCKGRLYRAAWVRNQQLHGTDYAPPGTPVGSFLSDQAIVQDVLTKCGVPYTSALIGGTGKTLGRAWAELFATDPLTPSPFVWAEDQAGLDFIESLDAASVPDASGSGRYRTIESLDGTIHRIAVATVPAATADFTFTEGVDVFDARISRDPTGAANRVMVDGMANGAGGVVAGDPGVFRHTVASPTAPYLPSGLPNGPDGYPEVTASFTSPVLEKSAIADLSTVPGGPSVLMDVLSCEAVANHLLAEYNCVLDTLEFSTPRDDLLGPGQTIHLTSSRLGLTDAARHYWLQRLEITMDERGAFTQRLVCIRRS